ncbi:fat storage-inducing transmembrane protein 1-like [Sardina pilchardus]|uniref:fat storage-inducing transmembrane protein 1-like n=1 Tax=Sardina pilchardus TaxID=27697 RepID=UPI002E0F8429
MRLTFVKLQLKFTSLREDETMSRNRLEDDLMCVICQDIFTYPVILTCSHSFCRACLEQFWHVKTSRECPVCSRKCSKSSYPLNRALRNVCEAFVQQNVCPRTPASPKLFLHYAVAVVSDLIARLLNLGLFRRLFQIALILLFFSGPLLTTRISKYSVFANKNHYLYRMFLSSVWGWTCILTGSFIFLLSFTLRRSFFLSLRHLSRLAAASAVWLGLRWLLTHLENTTGSCFEPLSATLKAFMEAASPGEGSRLLLRDGESKMSCLHAGFQWRSGCEVSQEALLLCLCSLLLLEEVSVFRRCTYSHGTPLRLLFLLCVSLLGLWLFLLFCLLIHFSQFLSQLIGGALGFMTWSILYQGWFRRELRWWCPGAPGNGLIQENHTEKDRMNLHSN